MRKILFITLSFFLILFSCKQEEKKEAAQTETQSVKKYCFIKSLNVRDGKTIEVDFVEYVKKTEIGLTLKSSQVIELPDEYCYLNREVKLEEFEFADTVKVVMQKFSYNDDGNFRFNQFVKLDELLNKFVNAPSAPFLRSPYEVEILDKKIIMLKEIYIP